MRALNEWLRPSRFATAIALGIGLGWRALSGDCAAPHSSGVELLEQRRMAIYEQSNPFDPGRQYFFVPPELTGQAPTHATVDEPRAAALFALAEEALEQDQGQLAFRLVHEVLQFDPRHTAARRWLGLPPDIPSQPSVTTRAGRRQHARFGWPAGKYWQVSTPHFQIATNDEPATATLLARTLEETHAVWEQLFFDCWSSTAGLKSRQQRQVPRRNSPARHQVVMFRDRDEYLRFVRTIEPRAELTRGYYHAPSRTAYFAGGDPSAMSTWRHEVTHQLFFERLPTGNSVGSRQNCWIIEGAAMYVESLQSCRQWLTVGGLEAERLQQARFRALRGAEYLPLAQLSEMSKATLQADPKIAQLYSQAAGVTHFLMDAERGRLRPALQALVRLVYQQRDTLESLQQLTGLTWEELDRGYMEFLRVDDERLSQIDPDAHIRELCLGGTSISDRGLTRLPRLDAATWLDFFATQLSDAGGERLAQATRVESLTLAQTQISDATVARLSGAEGLQQLDLSGTPISDVALQTVGTLVGLENLWLADTQISDEGLRHLEQLQQLRKLDLSGTRCTDAGRNKLRQALPNLAFE